MKNILKKSLAAVLMLCLCLSPMTAWAEGPEALDAATHAELIQSIVDANQLEAVFSRHDSLRILFSNPDAPDGYDLIWETADTYFQTYADWAALWERDQIFYEMYLDEETDSLSLLAGYDYDRSYESYCFVGVTAGTFLDAEHELSPTVCEEDGKLVLSTEYDEDLSRKTVEDLSLEYTGQTVFSRLTVDAESLEILSLREFVLEDGEERVISAVDLAYDLPEPIVSLTLRAAFERDGVDTIDVRYVIDPDTERETVKTMTVPVYTNCWIVLDSAPYVYFYDREQTVLSGWDKTSDLTVYVFTDPDEELSRRFEELYDAAYPEGLVLKDADGNALADGAILSGSYYYKVYVEGVPEDYEGIQTAWVRDVLDAEEPVEWDALRYLYEDEIGRYILVVPVVGADYTQETMFARLDEDDPNLIRINFLYDRETVKETEPPTLITEDDPKVGQTDYMLEWEPVEGAEFYGVLWVTPSEEMFYYGVTEPEFPLSEVEGALDEAGEYTLYIFPYGDGLPFTYGAWTSQVTEAVEERGEAVDLDSVTVEALIAANTPDEVFARHQTVFCTTHNRFDGEWCFFAAPGLYYESNYKGWNNLLDGDINWFLVEGGEGERTFAREWYIMSEAERQDVQVSPEDISAVIDLDLTQTEKLLDVTDNEDGTLTVVTRKNAEDTRAGLEAKGIEYTEEYQDAELEVVYLVAADTLEILSYTEYFVTGEERSLSDITEVSYDMELPETAAEMQAMKEAVLVGDAADTKTITVVYDAQTESEESYSLTVPRDVRVQLIFRDGYDFQYADPERSTPFDGTPDADGNYQIYAFAEQ